MKGKKTVIFAILILILTGFSFQSCIYEPEQTSGKERLILIYAIAANNLQPNLRYDMDEILLAARQGDLDLEHNKVLVYSVIRSGECLLQELTYNKKNKDYEFRTVIKYPELPLSTDPERISDVISYVENTYCHQNKGLVLWSHADGWIPWFGGSTPVSGDNRKKSFGWDDYANETFKTNITALASAIPEGVFDFIWFDCCYMANIETVYQLREKTDYIVGSVLEIAADGMPYHLTMRYLLQKDAELEEAASAFYNYYMDRRTAVSVSIMKTSALPELAATAASIMKGGVLPTNLNDIQNYERKLNVRFYDMGQLVNAYENVSSELKYNFNKAMQDAVIYKEISPWDFNGRPVNVADYSGLSMHNFTGAETEENKFYTTLDWYIATH